ncbi:MAG TPA: 4'-phosphopantetheinyl transferase superfamily protein [Candidatus Acidoferrum sp.]|jgi:4'-phosphopantetheinyl transferase|nr:4'-phosphopantetheinyl transferase superfamily protein [Candidatus Acidoferrum sp.]
MNITDSSFLIEASRALPEDEVHLWRADLEALRGDESRWQKLLSADELARSARFHFARDRQRFVASRALLRSILASYLATDPNSLNFSYSKKEKPFLGPADAPGNVTFNLSHSGETALFAFTRGREIGVDVEQLRHDFDLEAIARRFFSLQERNQLAALPADEKIEAFFRCWTRKEAYIKATGDGLSLPLSQFDVSLAAGEKAALLATRPDGSEAGQWLLREVPAGSGYVAALCVRGKDWKLKEWSANLSA